MSAGLLRLTLAAVVLSLVISDRYADETFEDDGYDELVENQGRGTIYSFNLEHSVNGEEFSHRSRIDLQMSKLSNKASIKFAGRNELSGNEITGLERLSRNDDFYRVRLRSNANDPDSPYIVASMQACALQQSNFEETFKFHLDKYGAVVGLDYSTPHGRRCGQSVAGISAGYTGSASAGSNSQRLTSSAYAEFQQEATAIPIRAQDPNMVPPAGSEGGGKDGKGGKQEPQTPQSLLRRYWYVVAIVLVMMMSGGAQEEEGKGVGKKGGGGKK